MWQIVQQHQATGITLMATQHVQDYLRSQISMTMSGMRGPEVSVDLLLTHSKITIRDTRMQALLMRDMRQQFQHSLLKLIMILMSSEHR